LDVVEPCRPGRTARLFGHRFGHVDADRTAPRADGLRRQEQVHARTTADVHDDESLADRAELVWVRDACERGGALIRHASECLAIVAEELRGVAGATMEVEVAGGILRDSCVDRLDLFTELSCVEIYRTGDGHADPLLSRFGTYILEPRVSVILTAANTPEAKVTVATIHTAPWSPKASAVIPATRAPTA